MTPQPPSQLFKKLLLAMADRPGSLSVAPELIIERIKNRDASLWSDDAITMTSIANRLGWLDLPEKMTTRLSGIHNLVSEVRDEGITNVVLLGMGGSSLCPFVLSRLFPARVGFPSLTVFDTTDPVKLRELQEKLDIKKTLFIVASKSGTTVEALSAYRYWRQQVEKESTEPGRHFIAITDADTPLTHIAAEHRFRSVFLNQADIGGRYSALSFFGMVPAALVGIDTANLLDNGARAARACMTSDPQNNPGWRLGEFLARTWYLGRDKLTISYPEGLEPFGLWVEQLVAESTGKHGIGIVPVVGESRFAAENYSADRCFVTNQTAETSNNDLMTWVSSLYAADLPVLELSWDDHYSAGYHHYLWEYATAVAGYLLGINPFDEPDVAAAKRTTIKILTDNVDVESAAPATLCGDAELRFSASRALAEVLPPRPSCTVVGEVLLKLAREGDYFAVLAYLPESPAAEAGLQQLRYHMTANTGKPTTVSFGPRYLHSSGQLHKGGGNNGIFIMLLGDQTEETPIPPLQGGPTVSPTTTFAALYTAQAFGDFAALDEKSRRALLVRTADVEVIWQPLSSKVFRLKAEEKY